MELLYCSELLFDSCHTNISNPSLSLKCQRNKCNSGKPADSTGNNTHIEQAYIAMQNNDTQAVFRNLNLALNELETVQGNLTLTAPDGGSSSMQ